MQEKLQKRKEPTACSKKERQAEQVQGNNPVD